MKAFFSFLLGVLLCQWFNAEYPMYSDRDPEGDVVPTWEADSVLINVNYVKDYDVMEQVWYGRDGHELKGDGVLYGFSECSEPEQRFTECDIWIVKPTHVWNDPDIDTLGHEVLHGLLGSYHE